VSQLFWCILKRKQATNELSTERNDWKYVKKYVFSNDNDITIQTMYYDKEENTSNENIM